MDINNSIHAIIEIGSIEVWIRYILSTGTITDVWKARCDPS